MNYHFIGIGMFAGTNGWYSCKLSEYVRNILANLPADPNTMLIFIPRDSIKNPEFIEICNKRGLDGMLFTYKNEPLMAKKNLEKVTNSMTNKLKPVTEEQNA